MTAEEAEAMLAACSGALRVTRRGLTLGIVTRLSSDRLKAQFNDGDEVLLRNLRLTLPGFAVERKAESDTDV